MRSLKSHRGWLCKKEEKKKRRLALLLMLCDEGKKKVRLDGVDGRVI